MPRVKALVLPPQEMTASKLLVFLKIESTKLLTQIITINTINAFNDVPLHRRK